MLEVDWEQRPSSDTVGTPDKEWKLVPRNCEVDVLLSWQRGLRNQDG